MEPTGSGGRWGSRGVRIAVGFGLLAAALVGADGRAEAQEPDPPPAPFVDVTGATLEQARDTAETPTTGGPERSRSLLLNRDAMETVLANAPYGRDGAGSLLIELPAPDGTMMAFDVWRNAVMAPELAAAFPEITTYSGQGVDEPAATIAFDLTPHGFHAQVLAPSGSWYIDPAIRLEDTFHASFFRSDIGESAAGAFIEENAAEIDELAAERPDAPVASRSGSELRTHRLAVSATSNYTALFGGTQAGAQAAIATTVNRVNGIYQTELAIGLQLVGNNTSVVYEGSGGSCAGPLQGISGSSGGGATEVTIFTAAPHGLVVDDVAQLSGTGTVDGLWAVRSSTATSFVLRGSAGSAAPGGGNVREWSPIGKDCDPFNNTSKDINVNQAVVDQVIGDLNYDIGHVFTTTLGGVAGLGVVGVSDQKARGLTGLSTLGELTSDEFYVDFVAHEMGHQYGGDHTFNGDLNNCAGSNWGGAANSFEPGSGSTIQAYAGICGDDNLQVGGQGQSGDGSNASDPYFHSHSFDQIQAHVATIPSAGSTTMTGNNEPSANAGPDITIPAQTPFFLGATGTDADVGDGLTYNFEQRDQGAHSFLNTPEINVIGPLFRSFQPSIDDTSFFPRLSDLADGTTNQNAACPTLTGFNKNAADCWSQFLIQTDGANSIVLNGQRVMNFRATVRDNRAGGGGVDTDETQVTVRNTGTKFRVTAPNGGEALAGAATVTWDVAGTTAAPISASTVSIRLSTDGGVTFPTALATDVPNDGSHDVTMPNAAHTQARVMVHSGVYDGGSGFFDLSDANFTTSVFALSPPSAPINPQGTPGDAEVTVMWSPPSSDGGSPITAHNVTSSPEGKTCSTVGALSCTVTGLANGVSYTFAVTATNAIGVGPAANTPPVTPKVPKFTPVTQQRLEDTRDDPTPKYGSNTPDDTFTFNVYNYPGVLPSSGIEAVSLNLTVDQGEQPPIGGGFATVWNCVTGRPTASNINFSTTKPVPNAVITPVSPTGDVCVYVYGAAALLVDVNGYFPTGSDFNPVPQQRLEDTRPTKYGSTTPTDTFTFNVYNYPGVLPSSGIEAVSLNLTVDQGEQPPIGGGFATVWNCVTGRPTASNINFSTTKPVPNAVITPVSPTGDVCVYVYGAASLLVDVNGYFPTGSNFNPVPQQRLEDTRPTGKIGNAAGTGVPFMFNVLGRAGLPGSGVAAVSLNVTADRGEQPTIGGGFVTVYNCVALPTASNLNFSTNKPVPNAVITPVSPTGDVCVYVYGTADILVDVNGYFPD